MAESVEQLPDWSGIRGIVEIEHVSRSRSQGHDQNFSGFTIYNNV